MKNRKFFCVREYEDIYIVHHAFRHHSIIVSNDKFEDFLYKFKNPALVKRFFEQYLMHYDFIADGFQPSPTYKLPRLPGSKH